MTKGIECERAIASREFTFVEKLPSLSHVRIPVLVSVIFTVSPQRQQQQQMPDDIC